MGMGCEIFSNQKSHEWKIGKNVNLLIPIMVFLNNVNVFWENFPVKIIYFRGGVKK